MSASRGRVTTRERGLSLVELMIALAVGALLTLGMAKLFTGNSAAQRLSNTLSELQVNGRVASGWLKHDLRMAGHVGRTHEATTVRATRVTAMVPTIGGNCFERGTAVFDWALGVLPGTNGVAPPPLYGFDGADGDVSLLAGCLDGDDLVAGSDLVAVHYAAAAQTPPALLADDGVYLHSGLGGGVLFQCREAGAVCLDALGDARADTSGAAAHALVSRLYYVRRWAWSEEDTVPTLVRAMLAPDGTVVHEPLIRGVRTLQLRYGLDSDGDGEPDGFRRADEIGAPGAAAHLWRRVKSVRFELLVESGDADRRIGTAPREVELDGTIHRIAPGHLGKVFSSSVAVRNPAAHGV